VVPAGQVSQVFLLELYEPLVQVTPQERVLELYTPPLLHVVVSEAG
jgi:hypothetical protein